MNKDRLIIIQCGAKKIWEKYPDYGPCEAKDAYIGPLFKVNRDFAEACGGKWLILSARYGYIGPDDLIENYNETFKSPTANSVKSATLIRQVQEKGLNNFKFVIGIGGKEYREKYSVSFSAYKIPVIFPCAGLRIGEMMGCIKQLTEAVRRDPGICDNPDRFRQAGREMI